MPDNTTTGILEDFLAFLVPQPDSLLNTFIPVLTPFLIGVSVNWISLRPSCTLG